MIVALLGGLGNQLFQAAFGFSVAKARKEEVFLTRFRVDSDPKRSYSLDAFNFDIQFVNYEGPLYFHDAVGFNSGVYTDTAPNTTYVGYFQSERYFDVPLVRQLTQFRYIPYAETMQVANKIWRAEDSAFIHVRRGDYVNEVRTSKFHGNLSLEYYQEGIERIRHSSPNVQFFVFSDDPTWCRKAFPDFTIIDHNLSGNGQQAGQEWQDLWLMKECQHGVIANSAFGWWGAWLGDNKSNRTIIAPKKWFQNPDMYSEDIVPSRWIKA
jgi:hypothetical protein